MQEEARHEGEQRRMGRNESPVVQRIVGKRRDQRALAQLELLLLGAPLL
jgi:hypothetical protein